jgi:hypothetical protein
MAFSLDRTVSYVQISEPDLISIHRSTNTVIPSGNYGRGNPCEAFICVAREHGANRVCIALYDIKLKTSSVYAAALVSPDNGEYALVVREAEEFLANLGFTMMRVNLNFSPAMREVIMLDLKIMRPPKNGTAMGQAPPQTVEPKTVTKDVVPKGDVETVAPRTGLTGPEREPEAAAASRCAAEETLAANRAVHTGIVAVLEAERDALSFELASVQEEAETLRRELSEARVALNDENDTLRREICRLCSERDAATVAVSGELEALRAVLAITSEALSVERAKNESALSELEALERNAADELNLFKNKIESLTAEKNLLASSATELKLKAKGEIERLRQENRAQRRAAIKKLNSLKEELHLLAETRAIMTSPFGVSLPHGDIAEQGGGSAGPFLPVACAEDICFEPDRTLKGIPYAKPEDLHEVYRSFNKIQAAPAGSLVQGCEGFACLIKEERRFVVYVAWLMSETGQVLVCSPDHPPENANAARSLLRAGVGYFEKVGFLMDRLEMEADPDKRQRQLNSLPVFCRTVKECAA